MQIHTLASGSTGNSSLICDKDTAILIDAGISSRRLCKALDEIGISAHDLSGILITHEHGDHVRGLNTFLKSHDIPIFTPRTVANNLRRTIAGVDDFITEISLGQETIVGNLIVSAFPTPHDTPQSVGFRIKGSRTLGYCTDCGHVSRHMLDGLIGVDIAVIEANHDEKMLMDGAYPLHLKRRILSDHGHLSNFVCGELAIKLAESGTRQFILAHLSRENNSPRLAYDTVCSAFEGSKFTLDVNISICVAPEKDIFSPTDEV